MRSLKRSLIWKWKVILAFGLEEILSFSCAQVGINSMQAPHVVRMVIASLDSLIRNIINAATSGSMWVRQMARGRYP